MSRNDGWFSFSFNEAPKLDSGKKMQSLAACLPYEILQEIFQHYLPRKTSWQPLHGIVSQLILCHICASWRIAAFGDHRLWKNLHMYLLPVHRGFPYNDIAVPQARVNMIRWWTTRTPNSGCIYSFRFMHSDILHTRHVGKKYVNYREVFRVPAVRSARSMTLVMRRGQAEQWALLCGVSPFSQLRSLSLSWRDNPEMSELKVPPTPLLRRLEISDPRFAFPWAQLTHLIAHFSSRAFSWRNLLELCKNLQCAMVDMDPGRKHVSKSIVHSNLRQLVVQSRSFPHDLFGSILLPSLHSLRLSVIPVVYEDDSGAHWGVYETYSVSTPISLGSLHMILRSTPSLKELHLHNSINLFQLQSPSLPLQTIDPLSMFAPCLEHLIIEEPQDCVTDLNAPQKFANFVRSRWISANWGTNLSSHSSSSSGSGRTPRQLHVEFILRGFSFSNSALEDFYQPNVRLTITEPQGGYWKQRLGSDVGREPEVLDNWEELVKFRVPL